MELAVDRDCTLERHRGTDTAFARAFERAWAEPTPERLVALLHPEVTLHQPTAPPIRGREAALADFRRLFRWLPGLHGVVERSSSDGDQVFIEHRLRAPIGRGGFELPAVDRFVLRDGLAIERIVYFDRVPFVLAVLGSPRHVPGFLRYRFGG